MAIANPITRQNIRNRFNTGPYVRGQALGTNTSTAAAAYDKNTLPTPDTPAAVFDPTDVKATIAIENELADFGTALGVITAATIYNAILGDTNRYMHVRYGTFQVFVTGPGGNTGTRSTAGNQYNPARAGRAVFNRDTGGTPSSTPTTQYSLTSPIYYVNSFGGGDGTNFFYWNGQNVGTAAATSVSDGTYTYTRGELVTTESDYITVFYYRISSTAPTSGSTITGTTVSKPANSVASITATGIATGSVIDDTVLETFFTNAKNAYTTQAYNSNATYNVAVTTTVCHASCHRSCHGSRGRR